MRTRVNLTKINLTKLATLAVASAFCWQPIFAQRGSAPSSSSTSSGIGSAGSTSSGSLGSTGRTNSSTTLPGSTTQQGQQPTIFLNGTVMFDDGSKTNSDIVIERVCNGNPRPETHADSKGRFSFQVGQSVLGYGDASVSSVDSGLSRGNSGSSYPSTSGSGLPSRGGNGSSSSLFGCDLRASYPGYRSDEIDLSMRKGMDDPNVGTIVLHRLTNVQGTTISLTSAMAPKKAQKEYEKGLQLAQKSRYDEAEKHLEAAVDEYPKYAIALFQLGNVKQALGNVAGAQKSFQLAIQADPKYVSPYDRLASMAIQSGNWEEAETWSKQEIQLNPIEFPSGFFFNAMAGYQLKHIDEAEKSAKDLVKLDTAHHFPQGEGLLAQILVEKGQYAEAAAHLRTYLALVPNAKDAPALKQALAKIEQASAAAK